MAATVAVVAVLLVAGCGVEMTQQAGSVELSPTPTPSGTWVPDLPPATTTPRPGSYCGLHPTDDCGPARPEAAPPDPDETVYWTAGIRTIPAPSDAQPQISRAEAIAKAEGEPYLAKAEGPVDAALVLLTDGDWGPEQPNQRRWDHQLTWVITIQNVPVACAYTCPTPLARRVTTYRVAIDARTGTWMWNF
ncbi:MAG TPA: hypothetical protein VHV82_19085 [Sporichthyaceae bacterium]|jgi:hypothetical protein|nr:hypothetical protein [Sporichthyaceae bacterium]